MNRWATVLMLTAVAVPCLAAQEPQCQTGTTQAARDACNTMVDAAGVSSPDSACCSPTWRRASASTTIRLGYQTGTDQSFSTTFSDFDPKAGHVFWGAGLRINF